MATDSVLDLVTLAGDPDDEELRMAAALMRIERGTFGLCDKCQRPIERERIDAAPLTERCLPCRLLSPAEWDRRAEPAVH